MLVASFSVPALAKLQIAAVCMFQQSGPRWDPWRVWGDMQWPARSIVVILLVMSAWSLGVMIDRWIAYSAARKQSRQFAPMSPARCARETLTRPSAWASATRRATWQRS